MFIPKQTKSTRSPENLDFLPSKRHEPIGKLKTLHSTTLKQMLKYANPKQIEPFRIELSRIYTHNHFKVTNEMVNALWITINQYLRKYNWKRIKGLEYDLSRCSQISDRALKMLGFRVWKQLCRFLQLNFNFESCTTLTDRGLELLSLQICRQPNNIKNFTINFSGCYWMTDKSLQTIGSKISHQIPKLLRLKLNFNKCTMTDKGLRILGARISKHLHHLQQFTLSFMDCEISNKGLKSFGYYIGKYMLNIKKLTLNFPNCQDVTDEGVQALVSKLGNSLEILTINFSNCWQITDRGFKALLAHLMKHLKRLKHLTLVFKECESLTDRCLEGLEGIIPRGSLDCLFLNFNGCADVTYEAKERLKATLNGYVRDLYMEEWFFGIIPSQLSQYI